MILDSEEQRKLLLDLISAIAFHGDQVEKVYELKKAILEAEIKAK